MSSVRDRVRKALDLMLEELKARVVFDCPWTGHVFDDRFALRNSAAPNVIGYRCVKCEALVYKYLEMSQVVGPDGNPLAKA